MITEFDSESIYGDSGKYIKTKTKSYGEKLYTNFQGKKIPKQNTSYKFLSLIMLDSVISVNKKYYPQTIAGESESEINNNKMKNLINADFNLSSSDNESGNESNDESDKESNH